MDKREQNQRSKNQGRRSSATAVEKNKGSDNESAHSAEDDDDDEEDKGRVVPVSSILFLTSIRPISYLC